MGRRLTPMNADSYFIDIACLAQDDAIIAGMYRACLFLMAATAFAQDRPLRLAIAGLEHGHVSGFLRNAKASGDVQIVGVFDPDEKLRANYAKTFGLPADILFSHLDEMLNRAHPEAVATFTSTSSTSKSAKYSPTECPL